MDNRMMGGRQPPHPELPGRLPYRSLAEYRSSSVQWFLQPFVPRGVLTLVVGESSAGKSSFLAWLISQAQSALLFPGFEESFRVQTLPRLQLYSLRANQVHVVDAGDWHLPDCRVRLLTLVRQLQVDLVVMDPVSSYMRAGSSANDAEFVRSSLESLSEIAAGSGAAIVGVRHPGKAAHNVMMGSAEWRNVPRSIVQLLHDPGPPSRRMIRVYKDSFGMGESTRSFDLVGHPGEPRRFALGAPVGEAEACQLARLEDDLERSRFAHAQDLLRAALCDEEQASTVLYALALAERISERTLYRAATALGVSMRREGSGAAHRCLWSLPAAGGGVGGTHGVSADATQPMTPKEPAPQELQPRPTDAMTHTDTPPQGGDGPSEGQPPRKSPRSTPRRPKPAKTRRPKPAKTRRRDPAGPTQEASNGTATD